MKNTDIVIKFPNSKRILTPEEERELKICANLIDLLYKDGNPFITPDQKIGKTEKQLELLVKRIFELNEAEL
jgi:hypothetical protein|tara:strand:- start:1329 stop:1544 length:216 start_codon:yes stop_codon:yes gene_type:complete